MDYQLLKKVNNLIKKEVQKIKNEKIEYFNY